MEPLAVSAIIELLTDADLRAVSEAVDRFAGDRRPGVIRALGVARRRLDRQDAESRRLEALATVERELMRRGLTVIAGVDEVGRGALAGPVSAGACVLPADATISGLRDSKALSAEARVTLDAEIRRVAVAVAVAHVPAARVDLIGIAPATLCAMHEAVAALGIRVDHVLVDGLDVALAYPHTAVVKGDDTVRSIAAAAIVAKVSRDALMCDLDSAHPGYGFSGNKGYGSTGHLQALAERGPCAEHRLSFGPCSQSRLF
jgi:ribonuclease HII